MLVGVADGQPGLWFWKLLAHVHTAGQKCQVCWLMLGTAGLPGMAAPLQYWVRMGRTCEAGSSVGVAKGHTPVVHRGLHVRSMHFMSY